MKVAIIGAGITGILAAYFITELDSEVQLTIFDAGPEPKFSSDSGILSGHYGATLGQGRDSRHFTGTEGLSFQNPIHTQLLCEVASNDGPGWQTIPENELSPREIRWREECLYRYKEHVSLEHNPYDQMYTILNYGGMAAWDIFGKYDPRILDFRLSRDSIYVAFGNNQEIKADFDSETAFNSFQETSPVSQTSLTKVHDTPQKVIAVNKITDGLLRVPGETWAIQSLWKYLYDHLASQERVKFSWNHTITRVDSLPDVDCYIWAAGSSYAVPDIYTEHGRVQGVGGWWLTIPNPGFKAPFKFSAPQPSGYINFTPSSGVVHISGGFGWTGERSYKEAEQLLQPVKKHFLEDLSEFLNVPLEKLRAYKPGCCIRPTTPTGLPDIKNHLINGKKHLTISGSGKAGSTQAPILAMHVAKELGLTSQLETKFKAHDQEITNIIQKALSFLETGLEP